ncbi:glycosyltransferase [Rugosimonospora africana]|uniref:glycosyltransferase n=1 Tax=Rugosimonospora africana TaxID=556532 RepID=UPI001EF38296|nr:glycosyltransferase family 2 protein [Rugosimonospora africana]
MSPAGGPVAVLALVIAGAVALLTVHTAVNARLLRRPARRPSTVEVAVSVLLPLRDEAQRVRPCLEALLAQESVPGLEIVVLDDGSTDGTADVVRAVAGDRVQLITGTVTPPGWLGKPWACHQLAGAARGEVLAFLDADVILAPHAVAAGVALLDGFDLICPYPRMVAATPGERLVQPLLQWLWLTFLPLRAMERSPRPSLAAAGGQFLVARRAGYERAGGHAAVAGAVLEDIELARAVKRAGGRIALADGSGLATCRMYASWAGVRDGYTKSLWASFGSPAGAAAAVLALLLLYVAPVALIPVAPWAGLAGYLLGVLGRVVTARATGGRTLPDALAHPVSMLIFGYLTARSYRLHRKGSLVWKGRGVDTLAP